jgi:2-succinyl-5-enolpyruvyl-6-hydroxy-3-cyclohexene-1-carboxylate synthase
LEEFFETKHSWNAKKIAETFDVKYFQATNKKELNEILEVFYAENSRPALLEIFTPSETNAKVLKNYFKELKNR